MTVMVLVVKVLACYRAYLGIDFHKSLNAVCVCRHGTVFFILLVHNSVRTNDTFHAKAASEVYACRDGFFLIKKQNKTKAPLPSRVLIYVIFVVGKGENRRTSCAAVVERLALMQGVYP